jgi:hypothetical protein
MIGNRVMCIFCITQLSEKRSLSVGIWLLFLDGLSPVKELFTGIEIPFNSEFLIARPEGSDVMNLIEVYRTSAAQRLETCFFGNWTSHSYLTGHVIGRCKSRNNLQGLKLKTGYIEVCFINYDA